MLVHRHRQLDVKTSIANRRNAMIQLNGGWTFFVVLWVETVNEPRGLANSHNFHSQ